MREMLDTAMSTLTHRLELRKAEIVEREMARIKDEAPDWYVAHEPAVIDAGSRSCLAHLDATLAAISRGCEVPAEPPPAALDEARITAQAGISLEALQHSYRVGHGVLWEITMDEVDAHIENHEDRVKVLRLISRFLFAYVDAMMPAVAEAYAREYEAQFRDSEYRKYQLVRNVLAELPIDEGKLGYRLSTQHLGVVAWGSSPEQVIRGLADALECQALTIPSPGGAISGWLGSERLSDSEVRSAVRFKPAADTFLALGEANGGIDGFRRTHRQAWYAYRVAGLDPAPITSYWDVSLLALALQDEQAAREFVLDELGSLAGTDERSALLRQTLEAYFATGQNATAAAAMLGVHDRTVAYRIRSIEERIGDSITGRASELIVALKLASHFERSSGRELNGSLPVSDKKPAASA
jgi:hypothetical protein